MHFLEFCIKECEIQEDNLIGELNYMRRAYNYAWLYFDSTSVITLEFILNLGEMIKPKLNNKGIRTTPVIFKNLTRGLAPQLIQRALENLIEHQKEFSPEGFYKEFELIHPFEDGNGRVGAILYNMLNDSMNDPILPPDLFIH
jgi:hypothetical protein